MGEMAEIDQDGDTDRNVSPCVYMLDMSTDIVTGSNSETYVTHETKSHLGQVYDKNKSDSSPASKSERHDGCSSEGVCNWHEDAGCRMTIQNSGIYLLNVLVVEHECRANVCVGNVVVYKKQ